MKSNIVRFLALSSLVVASFVAVGCKSTETTASGEAKAVFCDKCKTTWVQQPGSVGRITVYHPAKAMTCPDCKSAVESYFATGKLEHTCKTCGSDITPCETH